MPANFASTGGLLSRDQERKRRADAELRNARRLSDEREWREAMKGILRAGVFALGWASSKTVDGKPNEQWWGPYSVSEKDHAAIGEHFEAMCRILDEAQLVHDATLVPRLQQQLAAMEDAKLQSFIAAATRTAGRSQRKAKG